MSRFDWAWRAVVQWLASAGLLAFFWESWGAEWPPRSSIIWATAVVGCGAVALLFALSLASAVVLSALAISGKRGA